MSKAVPPLMAEAIAKRIADFLDSKNVLNG